MSKKRTPHKKRKAGAPRKLDRKAAAAAAGQGKTRAQVALAAGSKARSAHSLTSVGSRLMRVLSDRAAVRQAFDEQGVGIEEFARNVIARMQAKKVQRIKIDDAIEQFTDEDYATQAAACAQFMQATGLLDLPAISTAPGGGLLGSIDESLLLRIAAGEVTTEELESIVGSLGQ